MSLGNELNQFSDLALFCIVAFSILCGWIGGYYRGVINGHEYGTSQHPILNVTREDMPDGESIFVDMSTGTFIAKGPAEDILAELTEKYEDRKIIILQIEQIDAEDANDTI